MRSDINGTTWINPRDHSRNKNGQWGPRWFVLQIRAFSDILLIIDVCHHPLEKESNRYERSDNVGEIDVRQHAIFPRFPRILDLFVCSQIQQLRNYWRSCFIRQIRTHLSTFGALDVHIGFWNLFLSIMTIDVLIACWLSYGTFYGWMRKYDYEVRSCVEVE